MLPACALPKICTVGLLTQAFAQVRSIGKRECSNLFKLGDELIQFAELHQLLGASVAETLPVNPSVLLSDDAKRLARTTSSLARQDSAADASSYEVAEAEMSGLAAPKSFEGLMNSPWKVSLASCLSSRHMRHGADLCEGPSDS